MLAAARAEESEVSQITNSRGLLMIRPPPAASASVTRPVTARAPDADAARWRHDIDVGCPALPDRDHRSLAGRRFSGRRAPRAGLRRGAHPDRRRDRSAVRAAAAVQGGAARRRDEPDWVKDEAYYADQNITLVRGTVASRIDRDRRLVVTSGDDYRYDKLLLATGSTPRRLNVPGGDLDGLLTLRTYPDSLALRSRLTPARPWSSSAPAGSVVRSPPRPASTGRR